MSASSPVGNMGREPTGTSAGAAETSRVPNFSMPTTPPSARVGQSPLRSQHGSNVIQADPPRFGMASAGQSALSSNISSDAAMMGPRSADDVFVNQLGESSLSSQGNGYRSHRSSVFGSRFRRNVPDAQSMHVQTPQPDRNQDRNSSRFSFLRLSVHQDDDLSAATPKKHKNKDKNAAALSEGQSQPTFANGLALNPVEGFERPPPTIFAAASAPSPDATTRGSTFKKLTKSSTAPVIKTFRTLANLAAGRKQRNYHAIDGSRAQDDEAHISEGDENKQPHPPAGEDRMDVGAAQRGDEEVFGIIITPSRPAASASPASPPDMPPFARPSQSMGNLQARSSPRVATAAARRPDDVFFAVGQAAMTATSPADDSLPFVGGGRWVIHEGVAGSDDGQVGDLRSMKNRNRHAWVLGYADDKVAVSRTNRMFKNAWKDVKFWRQKRSHRYL